MIDLKFLRENPDIVKENIKKKFQDHKLPLVDEVIELDEQARSAQQEADALRANRNSISKQIGALMAQGKKEEAEETKKLVTEKSELLESLEGKEKELEEKEDIRHIQELIEQLPENQRQVIRLRGIEDCSYEDIEQITGLSSSNIRTLLSRARKLIREKLEKASCHG